ncbi:MAG: NERD domain-containing protein [Chloroflexota bacterium]
MARMIPERIPSTVKSAAEREVFRLLSEALDDHFTVFHSVAWVLPNELGQARDGEADYVIAHQDRGVLLIEVKGGEIAFDGESRRWTTINQAGFVNEIDSPIEQARANFHKFMQFTSSSRPTMPFRYPGGYGVIFPDGVLDGGPLPPDIPRQIIVDADDIDRLANRISGMLHYWTGGKGTMPGERGIEALEGLLKRSLQIRTPLRAEIAREEEEFRTLTERQYQILTLLQNQPRALITGCSGSGKTFLAVEKGRRLAEQGIPTLLTCFNKGLAIWIRESIDPVPKCLRVQHFHELAYDLAKEAGLDAEWPEHLSGGEYFSEHLPSLMYEAVSESNPLFDAIIVDEGQDFREDWWIPLLESMRSPDEGIFYIFYDDQQCIYTEDARPPFDAPSYPLTENLRNTRAIHRVIAEHYRGEAHCRGPEGREPTFMTPKDQTAALQRELHRFLVEEGVDEREIVVLTPASARRSRWKSGQRLGTATLTWDDPPPDGQVLVSTIQSFKGLERSVVIVTELPGHADEKLQLVAFSRARSELIVMFEK